MEKDCTDLLDQHVKVLGYLRCETYEGNVTLSVEDQAEAALYGLTLGADSRVGREAFHTKAIVPLDLRIRRILLPIGVDISHAAGLMAHA